MSCDADGLNIKVSRLKGNILNPDMGLNAKLMTTQFFEKKKTVKFRKSAKASKNQERVVVMLTGRLRWGK